MSFYVPLSTNYDCNVVPEQKDKDVTSIVVASNALEPCAICMKEFTSGDQIAISHHPDCTHYFHKECAASWLASGRSNTCACCRRQYLRNQSWDELRKATMQLTRSKLLWWEDAPENKKPVTSGFILHFVLNF